MGDFRCPRCGGKVEYDPGEVRMSWRVDDDCWRCLGCGAIWDFKSDLDEEIRCAVICTGGDMDKGDEQHEKAEEGVQGEAEAEHAGLVEEAGQGEGQQAQDSHVEEPEGDSEGGAPTDEAQKEKARKAEAEEAELGAPEVVGTTVSEKFMKYEPKALDPDKLVESAVPVADEIRKQEQSKALRGAEKAIRLVREDFDSLENDYSAAYSRTEVGIFVDDDKMTANAKVKAHLDWMEPVKVYLAWDGKLYPRFFIEDVVLR